MPFAFYSHWECVTSVFLYWAGVWESRAYWNGAVCFSLELFFSVEAQCPDSFGSGGTGREHGGLIVFFVCHVMLCIDDGLIGVRLELTALCKLWHGSDAAVACASCGYASLLLSRALVAFRIVYARQVSEIARSARLWRARLVHML